jgi:regulation of enolase protein 1 (concanavalin A-like superfamily)
MTESKLRTAELCLAKTVCLLTALLVNASVARAQVPAPWDNQNVGSVGVAGSASHASGVFTVRGSGVNIWDTADGFHFVYRPMTGDGQIVARVDSVIKTDPWAKAGVMMRDGLESGDANGFVFVSAGGNVRFQRRRTAGGTTSALYTAAVSMPRWVKLVRTGDTLAAYHSADGVSWTSAGTNTFVMNSTIYVGLAVTSHKNSVLSTGVFRNVSVTSTGGNTPPAVSLTAPANGAQFYQPATIALAATASDSGGTIQQVQFFNGTTLLGTDTTSPYGVTVSNVAEGSYTLRAVALDNAGATASSSVSVTVGPGPWPWDDEDVGSVNVAGSATFNFNSATVRGAGVDIWGTSDGFHFVYQTLAGDGEIVARVDSLQVTNAWAKAGVMLREALSGGSSHASAFVTGTQGIVFQRRAIPGGSSMSTAGSTSAAPRWVRIARVGSTFTASESSNGSTWTVVGSQTITMAPTLYVGLAVTSHSPGTLAAATFSNFTVRSTATSNQPPTVTITAPASGATFTAPGTIAIAASASDADGSVSQVQFFAGSTLLGTDTSSPYTYSWTNVAAGSYSLTAVARDNQGATRTSAAVSVTVTAAGPPTRAVFNPSPDHAVVTHYLLEIFRQGDTPGTSTPIASRNLGKPAVVNNEISVDIATLITPLAPGNYIATVSSVNANGSGRSAPPSAFVR